MLVANLRPKVVLPHGSRLLLGLIVRARGRLVDGEQILGAIETRPPGPALSERGPHSGHPRPVAPLSQRAGLLEIRPLPPAALHFPYLVSQSQLNRRIRALEPELRALQGELAATLSEPSEAYRVMDTTLIPAIVRARARRGGLFVGQASFGRCRSKSE
jgi:hypothetical protein